MFSLFAGKNIFKTLAVLVVVIATVGIIYGGYKYVTNMQSQIVQLTADKAILTANNLQLTQGIAEQKLTIEQLERDFKAQAEILQETYDRFQAANNSISNLERKLSEHDLGYLAANRPGLVENVINKASDNIARCFAIASGAPLTQTELNATLPSQINTECPELANPNFKRSK